MPQPDADLLLARRLIHAGGSIVSGEELAEALEVSRVAVFARIKKLRGEGWPIEGLRREGYRLKGEPKELSSLWLRAALQNPALGILAFPEIDSTNSEAERQLASGRETPFVVLSEHQTAGRGRLGRTWHSPPQGNLYATFAFRPKLTPSELAAFTLVIGVAVAVALRESAHVPAMVKWPNDIQVEGKKLAGILTEARIDTDRTRDLLLGIGLNVNSQPSSWDVDGISATSLRERDGQEQPYHDTVARTIACVLAAAERFFDDPARARKQLIKDWGKLDALAGKIVQASGPHGQVSGVVEGIDEGGRLRLRTEEEVVLISAGEVTLRDPAPLRRHDLSLH